MESSEDYDDLDQIIDELFDSDQTTFIVDGWVPREWFTGFRLDMEINGVLQPVSVDNETFFGMLDEDPEMFDTFGVESVSFELDRDKVKRAINHLAGLIL